MARRQTPGDGLPFDQWHDEGYRSWRIRRRRSWRFRRSMEGCWIHPGQSFWQWECIWGWGFHDRWSFKHRDCIQLAGLP